MAQISRKITIIESWCIYGTHSDSEWAMNMNHNDRKQSMLAGPPRFHQETEVRAAGSQTEWPNDVHGKKMRLVNESQTVTLCQFVLDTTSRRFQASVAK